MHCKDCKKSLNDGEMYYGYATINGSFVVCYLCEKKRMNIDAAAGYLVKDKSDERTS